MGFKTSEWAYGLDLAPALKSVLAALAHRTDDKTRECFPGQSTLSEMTGQSRATVNRALKELDRMGVISRTRRNIKSGYRTSDLFVLNTAYVAESQLGTVPTTQDAYMAQGADLGITVSEPRSHSDRAVIDQSDDQSVGQSVLLFEPRIPTLGFDDFWKIWPRSEGRKAALIAWAAALKRTDARTIVYSATAYVNHPHRPERQYVPHGATWLRGDRWTDPLPQAPEPVRGARRMPEDRMRATLALVDDPLQRGISS
jgi:biotin operon repressor